MQRAANTALRLAVTPNLPAALVGNAEVRAIVAGSQAGFWFNGAGNAWQRIAGMTVTNLDSGVLAGAAVTLAGVIPANCLILAVTAQVTVAITGSANWQLGDTAVVTRYGAALAVALGTQANVTTYLAALVAPMFNSAAAGPLTDIVITNDGANPFTGGRILIRIYSLAFPSPV